MILEFDNEGILKLVKEALEKRGMSGEVDYTVKEDVKIAVSVDGSKIDDHLDQWHKADV